MFTGIIKYQGKLERVERHGLGGRLVLSCSELDGKLEHGGSLAVDGVCLTMVEEAGGRFVFDLSGETLERVTLKDLPVGRLLNLELPLVAGDPIGGHLVSGHVDGIAGIKGIRAAQDGTVLSLDCIEPLKAYIYGKCSVTVNGVSLTVSAVSGDMFEIALIPETLRATNLYLLRVGDMVNLEADTLVKAKLHAESKQRGDGLTVKKLREAGFI